MTFRIALLGAIATAVCFGPTNSTLARGMAEKHIPSHAGMGQTVRIRGHVNLDRNFSGLIPIIMSVIQAHQRETLKARNEEVRSTDPEFRRARSRDRPVTESGRVASAADVVCVDGAVVTLDIGEGVSHAPKPASGAL